mgnify:CR=1 FL=1
MLNHDTDADATYYYVTHETDPRRLRDGVKARYVQLPAEAHGYRARESIGHTLYEDYQIDLKTGRSLNANFVDYKLTPRRLQPGFEAQLSKKSLFLVYAAFAVGLTVYDMTKRGRRTMPDGG